MKHLDPNRRENLIPKVGKCPVTGKALCRWCGDPVPTGRRAWCSQACVDDALIRTSQKHARAAVEARDKGVCADCGRDTRKIENMLRNIGRLSMEGVNAYDRTRTRAAARYGITTSRLAAVTNAGWSLTELEARREIVEAQDDRCMEKRQFENNLRIAIRTTPTEDRIRRVNKRLKKLATARLNRLTRELAAEGFDGIGRWGRVTRSLWDADHILPVVKGGGGCGLENYRTCCQPCHKGHTKRLAAERAAARKPPPHPELF
jgi:hypothetical protein